MKAAVCKQRLFALYFNHRPMRFDPFVPPSGIHTRYNAYDIAIVIVIDCYCYCYTYQIGSDIVIVIAIVLVYISIGQ